MKEGLKGFSPTQLASLRLIIAGMALMPFTIKFLRQMRKSDWFPMAIVAFCGNGIPYFLFAFAQTQLGSAFTAMLNSLVPLFTLVVGFLLFKVHTPRAKAVGVGVGLVGAIVLIYTSGAEKPSNVWYGLLVLLATICYAISVNTLKARLTRFNPLATAAIPIGLSMIPLLFYLPLFEPIDMFHLSKQAYVSLAAISVLGFVGTAVAMILFNRIIQLSSAVFASSVTYLIPVVAMAWGLADGEKIGMWHVLGLLAVLTAVYLINKKERKLYR
jgi:drug/metabolite transporter (DMT)-like permease